MGLIHRYILNMKWLKFFIPLFAISCSSTSDNIKETIYLIEESVNAVENATQIIYYQIKENAYEYQEGRPLLHKADQIDSLTTNYYGQLDTLKDSSFGFSRSQYLKEYLKVVEDINRTLKSDSFNPPEWFIFPSADSVISLDSLDSKIIPSAIKLNLALLKANVFRLLQLMAPSSISCEGSKTVYIINEEIVGNKVQFDLGSRVFGNVEDRYVEIDSVSRNGKGINVNIDYFQQFTFQRLSLDSLMPGTYKVFGTAIAFSNGNERTESFNHEFEIKGKRPE